MQAEYGESLNTILVESQGHDQSKVNELALKRKWFGSSAIWTGERPVRTNSRGIPNFVLLSPEGEVVMMGNPIREHKAIETYLGKFRKQKAKPPADMPRQLHSAWKNAHKGKFAAAAKEASRYTENEDAAISEAAATVLASVETNVEGRIARIDRAMDAGYFDYAKDSALDLQKVIKGHELQAKLDERIAQLVGDDLAAEVKAEKSLMKIEKGLYTKGADKSYRKKLEKHARKHAGTKAAERASELADAITE